jgi:hypothetical protein
MDNLDFLDGAAAPVEDVQPANVEPAAEPAPEPQPEPQTPRDEHGRFAPKAAAEPAPAEPSAPAPAEPPKPEPIMVPLAALHETRDKVKDLEAQLGQFRQAQQPQPQPVQAPDPYEDPEGFAAFQQQQTHAAIYASNLNWSARVAELQHGKELVASVMEWGKARCDADPYFNARLHASQDPVGLAIEEFQRSNIDPSDYAAFTAWKTAQAATSQAQPQPAQAAAPPTPAPPQSIVSAPSAGGLQQIATGPGVAFDDTIK